MAEQFDYETDLADDMDAVTRGKYKGMTPFEILQRDPGYIVWASTVGSKFWVGSQALIEAAKKIVPNQAAHTANKQAPVDLPLAIRKQSWPTVEAFEETMLETFGEFPTPGWKTYRKQS